MLLLLIFSAAIAKFTAGAGRTCVVRVVVSVERLSIGGGGGSGGWAGWSGIARRLAIVESIWWWMVRPIAVVVLVLVVSVLVRIGGTIGRIGIAAVMLLLVLLVMRPLLWE